MRPYQLERAEGRALIMLVARYEWGRWLFHVPNESINVISRKINAGQGVRSGVPDYLFLKPRSGFHGLAFELKAPRPYGASVSKTQKEWLAEFSTEGYATEICYGAEIAERLLIRYMAGEYPPKGSPRQPLDD